MASGKRDRRVQLMRSSLIDDGLAKTMGPYASHGSPVWASKTDIRDDERWRAGEVGASVTTRFGIVSSVFSRGLTPKDRLVCDGTIYEITGIKEIGGRRKDLEITASARTDG